MIRRAILILLLLLAASSIGSAANVTIGYAGNNGTYTTDGTLDDVQINQALTAVNGAGGGTVYLKGGATGHTYNIDDQMNVGSNTIVTGDPNVEVRLINAAAWGTTEKWIFEMDTKTNVTFSGFTIDGNSANQTESLGAGYYNMLDFYDCSDVLVDNMVFEWGHDDAVYLQISDHYVITNCTMYKLGHEGVYHNYCSDGEIAYNDIFARTDCAVRLSEGAVNVSVHDNELWSLNTGAVGGLGGTTGQAIQISKDNAATTNAFDNIDIYNNQIYSFYGTGIWAYALYNSNTIYAKNLHIYHNTFTEVGTPYTGAPAWNSAGITLWNFNNSIIENNVFDTTGIASVQWWPYPGDRHQVATFTTTIRNNVLMNALARTGTGMTGSGVGIRNNNTTQSLFIIQNNDIYNNSLNTTYPASGGWATMADNINADPLFYNATNSNNSLRDYHPKAGYGRWTGSTWYNDAGVPSPLIDAGLASMSYSLEPEPNGDRINIGRYGNTAEATKSLIPGLHTLVQYQWMGTSWIPLSVAQNNTGYIGGQLEVTVS